MSSKSMLMVLLLVGSNAITKTSAQTNEESSRDVTSPNGVCFIPSTPVSAITSLRFLRITAGDAGQQEAIRVTFMDLPAPFDVANGVQMWVGPPFEVCENSGQGPSVPISECAVTMGSLIPSRDKTCGGSSDGSDPLCGICDDGINKDEICISDDECPDATCLVCAVGECIPVRAPTLFAASLQCEPHYMDWTTLPDVLNVTSEFIIPSGTYALQSIGSGNPTTTPDCYSEPLVILNPVWGDLRGIECTGGQLGYCSPPDGAIDIPTDLVTVVEMFKNTKFSIGKVRSNVQPSLIVFKVSFRDLVQVLNAFSSKPYPFEPSINNPCP